VGDLDFGFSRCGIAKKLKETAGAKAQHGFVALSAARAEALTYQSCTDTFL
jgi:hypothetical protein